ncbi:hypothetical protein [Allorhodopirellula solitaria]|uniref:hypothetical protein n=1 Tax=Allorhodopirellula solitaria TaxID=2527987 RepID=UPI0011B4D916|nr:hypothetical protein [Allorhodopirellula solitaria]
MTALCSASNALDVVSDSRRDAQSDCQSVVAALRDGATIELVAVIRIDDAGNIAWQPDGCMTEISDDWPDVLRVKNDNPSHGFLFKFDGFKKGRGIGWDTRLTTPLPGKLLKGFVSVTGKFPKVRSTDIRVGVLGEWGPWQPVEVDGSITSRVNVAGPSTALYTSIDSLNVMGKSKPLVAPNREEGSQPLASLAEYEVVAVDSQGQRHRRKGVGVWKDTQAPYFDLSKIDLSSFEFRLRPYTQWVEFKNVPLEAPVPDVEVGVTEL